MTILRIRSGHLKSRSCGDGVMGPVVIICDATGDEIKVVGGVRIKTSQSDIMGVVRRCGSSAVVARLIEVVGIGAITDFACGYDVGDPGYRK